MNPISVDNVVSTYRLYAPLYDRTFGAVLGPGRNALCEAVCAVSYTHLTLPTKRIV